MASLLIPGNREATAFSVGGRLRYAANQIAQNITFKLDLAEAKATKRRKELFAVYDVTVNLHGAFYEFANGWVAKHGRAETSDDDAEDDFLGFGAGYRIYDTERVGYRVQAGIGASYLEDGVGHSSLEPGLIAYSRVFYELGTKVFLSNVTDILKTKTSLRANNDLGISIRMSERIAAWVSYRTDYNDNRGPGLRTGSGCRWLLGCESRQNASATQESRCQDRISENRPFRDQVCRQS